MHMYLALRPVPLISLQSLYRFAYYHTAPRYTRISNWTKARCYTSIITNTYSHVSAINLRHMSHASDAVEEQLSGGGDKTVVADAKGPKRKRGSNRKSPKSEAASKSDIHGSEKTNEVTTRKKRRRKTPEEGKVYDIAPIENVLRTTFKGRLGYACLNTVLRSYSTPVFCSRTCRLSTIASLGDEYLRTLGLQNLADLHTLIKWNAEHQIFFLRMSSEMFPFASHPVHGYDLSFADTELKKVGRTAKELGMRLTSHPGQFTQLGSPRQIVVENAVRDLTYHCEMMDRMGLDKDSVMIIHMGGTFGDKSATLDRFRENYMNLSDSIKRRLVLENDELCYNVDDLLPICQELNIPLVFDYHHDWIYPSARPPEMLIPDINKLWFEKGIRPKQHYSEPRPGAVSVMERRAHSDRVAKLPDHLPDDMDLMLECKDKEQAVFYLYRLYNLCEVDPRVLRPPADIESLQTKGRKTRKGTKSKSGPSEEAKLEVEGEANKHGIPRDDAGDALTDAKGELDYGSINDEDADCYEHVLGNALKESAGDSAGIKEKSRKRSARLTAQTYESTAVNDKRTRDASQRKPRKPRASSMR